MRGTGRGVMAVVVLSAAATLASCAPGAPTAVVGECLDIALEGATVTELEGLDCELEHDAEVYFVGALPGVKASADAETPVPYDGAMAFAAAQALCRDKFFTFVGTTYEESVFDIYLLYPDDVSWAHGDREVICAVFEPAAEGGEPVRVTGTLAGAKR